MRGVFTAGVLDAFHDKRLRPFDAFYGVSAGALNLTSFLSGQRGRNLQIYTGLCQEPGFISLSRFLKGGNLFDLDFFFEKINRQYSLDLRRFQQTLESKKFCVVTTCINSGTPHYLDVDENTRQDQLMRILKATSALPMIYRDSVQIDGNELMDGSLSDPLPVIKALNDGYRNITLIRTRPVDHLKKNSTTRKLLAWQYRNKPVVSELIRQQSSVYNTCLDDFSEVIQQEHAILTQVAPTSPLNSSRSTRDRARLVADYHLGYAEGYAIAEKIIRTQHPF